MLETQHFDDASNPMWHLQRFRDSLDAEDSPYWIEGPRRLLAAVRLLAKKGIHLPPETVQELSPWLPPGVAISADYPPHRVVGLVVDEFTGQGFIAPLRVSGSEEGWQIDPTLPFKADDVQDGISQLILAAGIPLEGAVPERLAFKIDSSLGVKAEGKSMHIAALLAVIDAADGCHHRLLSRACVIVQPEGSDRLCAVRYVQQKLEAFRRECGRGSLLVRAKGCADSESFRQDFDNVWDVDCFAELARKLDDAGLLRGLLQRRPLTRAELERATERLRRLMNEQYRFRDALDLARRLQICELAQSIPDRVRSRAERAAAELYRHTGQYVDAADASRKTLDRLEARRELTCYDELAEAAVDYAASLFDAHQFAGIEHQLQQWLTLIDADPLKLQPEVRVRVFNTLGRARVITASGDWERLFRRSLRLQAELDPASIARTRTYLIQGQLRHGRIEEGEQELEQLKPFDKHVGFSQWFLKFLCADLNRRKGRVWDDPTMEREQPKPGHGGHPIGFYFQATARQLGREATDAADRFRRAHAFFECETGGTDRPNILYFLMGSLRLAEAGIKADAVGWVEAAQALRAILQTHAGHGLACHYERVCTSIGPKPEMNKIEDLLECIPYF